MPKKGHMPRCVRQKGLGSNAKRIRSSTPKGQWGGGGLKARVKGTSGPSEGE